MTVTIARTTHVSTLRPQKRHRTQELATRNGGVRSPHLNHLWGIFAERQYEEVISGEQFSETAIAHDNRRNNAKSTTNLANTVALLVIGYGHISAKPEEGKPSAHILTVHAPRRMGEFEKSRQRASTRQET
jgi:hypothetical protein